MDKKRLIEVIEALLVAQGEYDQMADERAYKQLKAVTAEAQKAVETARKELENGH